MPIIRYEWQPSPLWECLPEFENFCYFIPLKASVFIISVIALIQSGFVVVLVFMRLGWACNVTSETISIIAFFSVPIVVMMAVSSLTLLCFKYVSTKTKCKTYEVIDIFLWVILLSHIFGSVVLVALAITGLIKGCPFPFVWFGLYVISCFVWFYFMSVIHSYQKEED